MGKNIDLEIENVIAALRMYGYRVTANPAHGQEEYFLDHLKRGLFKVYAHIEEYQANFGASGVPLDRVREMLRRDLPEPCFGVSASACGAAKMEGMK